MERIERQAEPGDADKLALELLRLKIRLQQLKTQFELMPDDVRNQKIKEAENGIVELELQRMQKP